MAMTAATGGAPPGGGPYDDEFQRRPAVAMEVAAAITMEEEEARVWGQRFGLKKRGKGELEVDGHRWLGFCEPMGCQRRGTAVPAAQPASEQAQERGRC